MIDELIRSSGSRSDHDVETGIYRDEKTTFLRILSGENPLNQFLNTANHLADIVRNGEK